MEKRIQIDAVEPLAFKAMFGLEKYLQQSQLDKTHYELIKIRASQINGCAFCLDMHTKDALKLGEDAKRLFLLDAWWETELFSEEERVILKATEEITLVHKNGLSTETYENAIKLFDEHYLSQIIMAIITINAWNRIAISTHKPIPN
ncbi:carboxymuconolactone decarboxylase family protein [Muricauda oceani]|uniref:Carboxymuconolactone decarboxylase family protein n=1 Tax=Flagellimonas oceani TaxID=2698672 RepID=A0A6G7J1W9_9FLAO|nr:carboxymuconolactone decarboxylase family protein [Allomuricauda oceani]MBW8245065.1 carboxymuconolactone decarboxylase family protein [Allomuricauda oceani]QII44863.1 carboxymuconolactone decarboxylase family protein [Allomuricauda oceani]